MSVLVPSEILTPLIVSSVSSVNVPASEGSTQTKESQNYFKDSLCETVQLTAVKDFIVVFPIG